MPKILTAVNPKTFEVEREYMSGKEAAADIGVTPPAISVCIKSQRVFRGYLWRWANVSTEGADRPKTSYYLWKVGDTYHIVKYYISDETIQLVYNAISNAALREVWKPKLIGQYPTELKAKQAKKLDKTVCEKILGDDQSPYEYALMSDDQASWDYKIECPNCGQLGNSYKFRSKHMNNCEYEKDYFRKEYY
jgi:hypothetical protein